MMTIVPNSHAREEEKSEVKGEYGGIWGEEEGDADYGGMVRPSQQDVAPSETGGLVRRGLDTRGVRIVARFDRTPAISPTV